MHLKVRHINHKPFT